MTYTPGDLVAFGGSIYDFSVMLEIIVTFEDKDKINVLTADSKIIYVDQYKEKTYNSIRELILVTDRHEPIIWRANALCKSCDDALYLIDAEYFPDRNAGMLRSFQAYSPGASS